MGRLPPAGVALTSGMTHALVFVACSSTGPQNALTDSIASMASAAYIAGMIAVAVAVKVYPVSTLWSVAPIAANAYRWGEEVAIVVDPLWGPSSGRLVFLAGQTALLMVSIFVLSRLNLTPRPSERLCASLVGVLGLVSVLGILGCKSVWASMPSRDVVRSLFASRQNVLPLASNGMTGDDRVVGPGQVVWLRHGSVVIMDSAGSVRWVQSANGGRAVTIQTCRPCRDSFDDAALVFSSSVLSALGIAISASLRKVIGWQWRASRAQGGRSRTSSPQAP